MIEAPETPHIHHQSDHRWFDIAIAVTVVLVSLGSLNVFSQVATGLGTSAAAQG